MVVTPISVSCRTLFSRLSPAPFITSVITFMLPDLNKSMSTYLLKKETWSLVRSLISRRPFSFALSSDIVFGLFLRKCASIFLTVSGSAGPAKSSLYFIPLYAAGLWLAVMIIPPVNPRFFMARHTAGVETYSPESRTLIPLAHTTSAAMAANSSERNLVSYPITICPLSSVLCPLLLI